MNFADSDEMGRHFKERGFEPTLEEGTADAVLVNTCTVRDLAEHKAESYLGRLKEWKKSNASRMIFVTGCAAERAKKELKHRFPYVDLIVGAKDIEQFPVELDSFLKGRIDTEEHLPEGLNVFPSDVIQYVTIMRACNYNCSKPHHDSKCHVTSNRLRQEVSTAPRLPMLTGGMNLSRESRSARRDEDCPVAARQQ